MRRDVNASNTRPRPGLALAVLIGALIGAPGSRTAEASPQFGAGPIGQAPGDDPRITEVMREVRVLQAKLALKQAELQVLQAEAQLRALGVMTEERRASDQAGMGPSPDDRTTFRQAGQAIREALETTIVVPFPDGAPLEDVLTYIRSRTRSDALPDGLPLTLDAEALEHAGASRTSRVTLKAEGLAVEEALARVLGPLGLATSVEGGRVRIIAKERDERPKPPDGDPDDPRSQAIREALEKPVSMPFVNETPLEDVIKYVKSATESPALPGGIPIYVDPMGLEHAETTMTTPVTLQLEGTPLKTSLRLLLRQVGLRFTVEDGLLQITSADPRE